jgi:hypothetical protein
MVIARNHRSHVRLVRCDRDFFLEEEFAVVGKVIESAQVQDNLGY